MFSRISEIKFGTAQAGDKSVKKVEDKRLEPIFTTYNKTKAETVQQQDYANSVVDNGDYADDGNEIIDLQTEEGTKPQAEEDNNKPQAATQEGKPEAANNEGKVATQEGNEPAQTKPNKQSDEGKTEQKAYNDYTVQEGEHFKDLIVRSLKAQNTDNEDYEPTEEEINKEIEDFKANNPEDTVKERNGKMYLLAGAKVKIAGGLEDKNNGEEQEQKWLDRIRATRKTKRGGSAAPVQGDAGNNDKKAEEKKDSAPVKKSSNDKSKGADNKKGSEPVKNNNNEPKNLRNTYKEGVFYDEKTKTHYKKENNKWVEVKGIYNDSKIKQYNKGGSWIETSPWGDGSVKTWCRANGTKIKEEIYDSAGKRWGLLEYDNNGNRAKYIRYTNGKADYAATYYPNGNLKLATVFEKDCTTTESYDKNGNTTKRVQKYKNRTRTWVYQNGKTLKIIYKDSSGVQTQLYDPKSGKQIRTEYPNGEIGTFRYLKNGYSIEETRTTGIFSSKKYYLYDRNGNYLAPCDANGNLIKE